MPHADSTCGAVSRRPLVPPKHPAALVSFWGVTEEGRQLWGGGHVDGHSGEAAQCAGAGGDAPAYPGVRCSKTAHWRSPTDTFLGSTRFFRAGSEIL